MLFCGFLRRGVLVGGGFGGRFLVGISGGRRLGGRFLVGRRLGGRRFAGGRFAGLLAWSGTGGCASLWRSTVMLGRRWSLLRAETIARVPTREETGCGGALSGDEGWAQLRTGFG